MFFSFRGHSITFYLLDHKYSICLGYHDFVLNRWFYSHLLCPLKIFYQPTALHPSSQLFVSNDVSHRSSIICTGWSDFYTIDSHRRTPRTYVRNELVSAASAASYTGESITGYCLEMINQQLLGENNGRILGE